ncbi:hypothetical protein EGR_10980 [Echinococcus granulosus]|uniref:Uncharacterized protein n=1 Tax=Echinococcus granulosus TaxID=6210 RepID=W6U720_ECHGR|nr:hypothetical protein EGR_10980 [Echinococcus granulosus]EUB54162.1 hypothetical protein EGR_10980 [Echinococcus granulosus]
MFKAGEHTPPGVVLNRENQSALSGLVNDSIQQHHGMASKGKWQFHGIMAKILGFT